MFIWVFRRLRRERMRVFRRQAGEFHKQFPFYSILLEVLNWARRITWPILQRAVMFCCFLAVLSVGTKQQRCSFFAGLEEKGRADWRMGWGAGKEKGQKCQTVGTRTWRRPMRPQAWALELCLFEACWQSHRNLTFCGILPWGAVANVRLPRELSLPAQLWSLHGRTGRVGPFIGTAATLTEAKPSLGRNKLIPHTCFTPLPPPHPAQHASPQ